MLGNQTLMGTSITNAQPIDLLRASVTMYVCQEDLQNRETLRNIESFHNIYKYNLLAQTADAEKVYLKYFLAADLKLAHVEQLIDQLKVMSNTTAYDMPTAVNACQHLPMFRFKEEEIFSTLANDSSQELTNFVSSHWDIVKNFLEIVSRRMLIKSSTTKYLTLEEAIQFELKRPAARRGYTKDVTYDDVKVFLHPDFIVALYEHARAKLVIFHDHYNPREADREALRAIGVFQMKHPELPYLEANYGLRDLNFAPADCLEILEENVDSANLTNLLEKIEIMLSQKNKNALPELIRASKHEDSHIPTPEELANVQLPLSLTDQPEFWRVQPSLAQASTGYDQVIMPKILPNIVPSGLTGDLALRYAAVIAFLVVVAVGCRYCFAASPLSIFARVKTKSSAELATKSETKLLISHRNDKEKASDIDTDIESNRGLNRLSK